LGIFIGGVIMLVQSGGAFCSLLFIAKTGETMKKTPFGEVPDIYLETVKKRSKHNRNKTFAKRKKYKDIDPDSPRGRFHEFMYQDVASDGLWIIPPQYTFITIAIFATVIPVLTGMAFFFFYMSRGDPDLYSRIHTGGILLDWAIGYEIIMFIILAVIAIKLLSFVFASRGSIT